MSAVGWLLLMPGHPAPHFQVQAPSPQQLRSAALYGWRWERAFVAALP